LSGALRHVTQLHKARLALDAGERPDMALGAFIPPLHFRRKSSVEAALAAWTAPRLLRAMEQLAEAALNVRRTPALAESLAQRALLAIAMERRRKDR
jgi:DNA polymerase-3 subunit delta